jgi:putative two-component system response regulator
MDVHSGALESATRSTILAVDDNAENLAVLAELLAPHFRVLAATSGEKALRIAAGAVPPDLILLDVMMPGMNGHQVFARLRADPGTADIPVIFLTAMDSTEAELQGLLSGAVDYITKPFAPPIVLARIRIQLELKRARDRLKDQNAWLEAEVRRRMAENDQTQLVSIRALAYLAEIRDPETGQHIIRTQNYVRRLAVRLRRHPRFRDTLNRRYIDLLTRSAPLHDIGKVGIPDAILSKPGPLSPEEWEVMKTHARLGADAIEKAERDARRPVDFLRLAREIAHWHHEKWNGSGYPDGLAGDAIPISARLMAIADVFDALISPRVYKKKMSYEQAREIIQAGRGIHFDPDVVDAFIEGFDHFVVIAERHRDGS